MANQLKELGERIAKSLKQDLLDAEVRLGELSIHVPREASANVLTFLRVAADLQFKQLIDICGVDYPEKSLRFEVVYHLLSLRFNRRIRIKIETAEGLSVPSVTGLFKAANWFEREVWDMYGVTFSGHPDLRRLLTDYGFEGHPLRKDFPLTGYLEMRYDPEQMRVVYEPVQLPQAFRDFDFLSPWEGMT
ncbi:MAG: NADH-quinone oxidoreductase subunit C, partial [Alphaproteobacteria bacterium]|nr:NADH-quinone oxidoreductase subunit C [Alphaproteobacteria bacterium]